MDIFVVRDHVRAPRLPPRFAEVSARLRRSEAVCVLDVEAVSRRVAEGLCGVGAAVWVHTTDSIVLPLHVAIAVDRKEEDDYTMAWWNESRENAETLAWYCTYPTEPRAAALRIANYIRLVAKTHPGGVCATTDSAVYDWPKLDAFLAAHVPSYSASRYELNAGAHGRVCNIYEFLDGVWSTVRALEPTTERDLRANHDAFVAELQAAYFAHYRAMPAHSNEPATVHTALYDAIGILASFIWAAG